jgi:hypothetical protein
MQFPCFGPPGSTALHSRADEKELVMERVDQAITKLLALVRDLVDLVLGGLAAIEVWLRGQLAGLGVVRPIQTIILIAAAVVLIALTLRLFGGVLRAVVVIFLVLLALHTLIPVFAG